MQIFLGSDHRGFQLKEHLKKWLENSSHQVVDCGSFNPEPVDYPLVTFELVQKVLAAGDQAIGVICCGSGAGVAIAANKVDGIRCSVGFDPKQIAAARYDDHLNVLSIAADYTSPEIAEKFVTAMLDTTPSTEERHLHRLEQIAAKEREHQGNV
jgi:ribose 5-phosphate isomerase B